MQLDDALTFARTTNDGVLTTQKRDGRPQLSNITYLADDDGTIRISITTDRAKYFNLSRDARASLHVTDANFGSWVVIEADAVVAPVSAAPDDHTVEDLVDLYRRVLGEHPDWTDYRAAMVRERRTVVRLTPTRAYGQLR
ncbi:MAG: PPOX class F420-dependent oxidoreductase [Ilumatobacteraceae bacterium]